MGNGGPEAQDACCIADIGIELNQPLFYEQRCIPTKVLQSINTLMYRGCLRAPVAVPGERGVPGSLVSEPDAVNGDVEATEYHRIYGLEHLGAGRRIRAGTLPTSKEETG